MGKRKRIAAEARKEEMKSTAIAKLEQLPNITSKDAFGCGHCPREGCFSSIEHLEIQSAGSVLRLEKLIALCHRQLGSQKRRSSDLKRPDLIVREVKVDSARMLKRLQTAPQGRAHRIRKRSNHVTIIVDSVKN
jgi:large subunit ribosomal protein L22